MNKLFVLLVTFVIVLIVGFVGLLWYLGDVGDGSLVVSPTPTGSLSPTVPTEGGTSSGEEGTAQIYLVALEDSGEMGREIGCGDSLVGVSRVVEGQTVEERIENAYTQLFAIGSSIDSDSGYYTALSQSDLVVGEVTVNNGSAEVNLNGSLSVGGACDNPRIVAQLEEIPLQFEEVTNARVLINGEELGSVVGGDA